MATSTGKKARQAGGTRAACKAAKTRRRRRKTFGKLPISEARGNARPYREGLVDVVAEAAAASRPALGVRRVSPLFDLRGALSADAR